jgi:predicted MFS family arabinose efflux permease
MASINAITGVGVAGMSWTLRVAGATAAAAHPPFAAPAARAAAVIVPQRKRRTATAIVESVDRGTI